MKWWGWGAEGHEFSDADKPDLWPYIVRQLGHDWQPARQPPVPRSSIRLPDSRLHGQPLRHLRQLLAGEQLRLDEDERLVHALGKSFRDLWQVRQGRIAAAPDAVVYPGSEADVQALLRWAVEHDVVLIPFGGGSNIAGCLDAHDPLGRPVVSLDMSRLGRVLEVDAASRVARIESGVFGPDLERQLASHGMTLGHFPDSFLHSTLGGWIATRSAGMQSDKYGKIEDMVLALRVVTPAGTLVTRPVPRASNGIDVNRLCIGSEGILGVITEATVQVHPLPPATLWQGYLFPRLESGLEAVRECVAAGCSPAITRLNDARKTALSFAFKSRRGRVRGALAAALKAWLRHARRFQFADCCLLLVKFEGTRRQIGRQRRLVNGIYRRYGAVSLGSEPGRAFERGKFDFPHLRDWLLDRGVYADVSETATVWSNLGPLYSAVMAELDRALHSTRCPGWTGCHVSHTYPSGASLYFTFAWADRLEAAEQHYDCLKRAAEDAFLRGGATLSHHHAVGREHLPWISDDISPTGVQAVQALKRGLDPRNIMNPGKLIPASPGEGPPADPTSSAEASE
ncbi:MAG: FAD-binding oxidoreductase [Pirellulaceae bacterium]|nr:FAD-binding oxidoreductase [Pirellulaceae bacterium]